MFVLYVLLYGQGQYFL